MRERAHLAEPWSLLEHITKKPHDCGARNLESTGCGLDVPSAVEWRDAKAAGCRRGGFARIYIYDRVVIFVCIPRAPIFAALISSAPSKNLLLCRTHRGLEPGAFTTGDHCQCCADLKNGESKSVTFEKKGAGVARKFVGERWREKEREQRPGRHGGQSLLRCVTERGVRLNQAGKGFWNGEGPQGEKKRGAELCCKGM